MPEITAIMVDSREPDWIKSLKFGGVPTMVALLDTGDIQAVTSDNHTLLIERKTTDDFLNTVREKRLFPQLARMTEARDAQQNLGQPVTYWPYLVITDVFTADRNGKVITDRGVTGWPFSAVMGALLNVQEMGVFVTFANGQNDFQDCVIRLGKRDRTPEQGILSPRPAKILGPKCDFLAGIDGIEIANSQKILEWSNHNLGDALIGLLDLDIPAPVPLKVRKSLRALLSLEDNEEYVKINKTEIEQSMKEFVKGN